eukprot:s2091_g3.t1
MWGLFSVGASISTNRSSVSKGSETASRSQGSATLGLPSARHRSQSAGAVSALQLIPEEGESSDSLEETRMVADVAQASEPQSAARVVGAAGSQSAPSPAALPPTRIAPLRPTETKAKRWTLSQLAELRVLSSGLRWLHQESGGRLPRQKPVHVPKFRVAHLSIPCCRAALKILAAEMEVQLKYRFTFIHVELPQAPDAEGPPRAASCPPLRNYAEPNPKVQEQNQTTEAYLRSLLLRSENPGPLPQTEEEDAAISTSDAPLVSIDTAEINAPSNIGSLAHPFLCRRPCVYMIRSGKCELGNACEYCHHPHSMRNRLDSRQRALCHTMPQAQFLGLVIELMEEPLRGFPCPAAEHLRRTLLEDRCGT